MDRTDTSYKANGLALQVQLIAVEEFTIKLQPIVESSSFTVVSDPPPVRRWPHFQYLVLPISN